MFSSSRNLLKLQDILIYIFICLSVMMFCSTSLLSKIILFSVLFFIFLLNFLFIKDSNVSKKIFFIFLFYIAYLFAHSFFISKIPFDSKYELPNYILYGIVFLIFNFVKIKDDILNLSFLTVEIFVLFFYIFLKEESISYFFYNPNILSGWCLIVFVYSLCAVKESDKKITLAKVNAFLSFLIIILTKSYWTIFVGLFFIYLLYLKNYRILLYMLFCLVLILVFNFESIYNRVFWNFVGFKVIKDYPLGVGLENFKYFYPKYSQYGTIATNYIHNYFLHISVETGVFGLLIFLILVYISFKQNLKDEIQKYKYVLLSILFQNFFEYNLLIPQNNILFFIILGQLNNNRDGIKIENLKLKIFVFLLFLLGFANSVFLIKIEKFVNSESQISLMKATELDKTCWYAYKRLGIINFSAHNFIKAKEFFIETIKYNPADSESFLYLSIINFKLNNKKLAYKYFKEASILAPKNSLRFKKIISKFE
ncbi:MAG: O-antigen ligase family protein [Endomicrobia bacterium]|nr:O-antigen ligase family protein [Endomicrobiia bacterium]